MDTFLQAVEATGGDTSPQVLHDALSEGQNGYAAGPIAFDEEGCGIGNLYVYEWVKENGEYFWKVLQEFESVPMRAPIIDG